MIGNVKEHIQALRLKELQECLDRLGMKKNGKKAELQQRLYALFNDSGDLTNNGHRVRNHSVVQAAEQVIESVYRKQMGVGFPSGTMGASELAHSSDKRPSSQQLTHDALKRQRVGPSPQMVPPALPGLRNGYLAHDVNRLGSLPSTSTTIRCICGHHLERSGMIQCEGQDCGVWQHMECVGRKHSNGDVEPFFCERCRLVRLDPFWEPFHIELLPATRLMKTGRLQPVGTSQQDQQTMDRSFQLHPHHVDMIRKRPNEFRLWAVCLLCNDSVPFRVHWPLACDLRINQSQYRVYGRSAHTKLGANQRDEPSNLGNLCVPNKNRITVVCADSRPFVVLLQIVKWRGMGGVMKLMAPSLSLSEAVKRVQHQVAGAEDEEIETVNTVLSLKCPLTGSRIRTPGRFNDVGGLAAFDLDAFLSMAQRTRKWQCPHSMKQTSIFHLQEDSYLKGVLRCLEHHPDVTEVELNKEGMWRPAGGSGEFRDITDTSPYQDANGMVKQEQQEVESDSEEEDEEEELRKAAAELGPLRKKVVAQECEVIDLLSDSEDNEEGRPQPRPPGLVPVVPTPQGSQIHSASHAQLLQHPSGVPFSDLNHAIPPAPLNLHPGPSTGLNSLPAVTALHMPSHQAVLGGWPAPVYSANPFHPSPETHCSPLQQGPRPQCHMVSPTTMRIRLPPRARDKPQADQGASVAWARHPVPSETGQADRQSYLSPRAQDLGNLSLPVRQETAVSMAPLYMGGSTHPGHAVVSTLGPVHDHSAAPHLHGLASSHSHQHGLGQSSSTADRVAAAPAHTCPLLPRRDGSGAQEVAVTNGSSRSQPPPEPRAAAQWREVIELDSD